MARNDKLSYSIVVDLGDGVEVPWETLTEEQKDDCRTRITMKFYQAFQEYMRTHPEEFEKWAANKEKRRI